MKDEINAIYEYLKTLDFEGGGGGGGEVTSYNDLIDKPSIEGVTLTGDKSFPELNLNVLTNSDIEDIFSNLT